MAIEERDGVLYYRGTDIPVDAKAHGWKPPEDRDLYTADGAPAVHFRQPYEVRAEYDPAKGHLSFIDEQVTRVLAVRANFEEIAIRRACIIELERLGYSVAMPAEDQVVVDREALKTLVADYRSAAEDHEDGRWEQDAENNIVALGLEGL